MLTIVLYFGDEPWTAPLNLLGRIPVQDEALLPLLNDWRINLWQVAYSQPWQVRGLNSDFKFIADCCVQRRLKQEYRPISADKLVYPYETLELMSGSPHICTESPFYFSFSMTVSTVFPSLPSLTYCLAVILPSSVRTFVTTSP